MTLRDRLSSTIDLKGENDAPVVPKIVKLNSERDLFGLVDVGFNTFLYHWVDGHFYTRYDLDAFCDSLRSLILKEDTFVMWVACYKNNAKRPIMIKYESENKVFSRCLLNSEKLDFDSQDLHYVNLEQEGEFSLFMSNLKRNIVWYGQVSLDE